MSIRSATRIPSTLQERHSRPACYVRAISFYRCVIECYTFLRMGGTSEIERLKMIPLRGLRSAEIREAFRAFDVREAKCSSAQTTQLLLGVVRSFRTPALQLAPISLSSTMMH